ncbi:MAG TPA: hypothetical protein HA326_03905 [Thermoplasmata archaeon]|nr:hypothetical protein [Thermoplasmata archaeon]
MGGLYAGFILLQAHRGRGGRMQTETSQMLVVSLPMVLILGWAVAVFLAAYGAWKRNPSLMGLGLGAVGGMTLVTPLAWDLYATTRPDLFTIGSGDLLILAFLAFLGGGVLATGVALPSLRHSPAAKR